MMPDELSLKLYQFHQLSVQLRHDLWTVMFLEEAELLSEVDLFHGSPSRKRVAIFRHISYNFKFCIRLDLLL
jgi:hypothetical protein